MKGDNNSAEIISKRPIHINKIRVSLPNQGKSG